MEPHPEVEKESLPTEPSDLEFITFTDLSQITKAETKKKVRSHVMQRVQRQLRDGKGKGARKGEIVLDLQSLSPAGGGPSRGPSSLLAPAVVVPGPYDIGAGRSNPFLRYPIEMDIRTHELFDHLHGGFCPLFKTMDAIGFFKNVVDEAGFRQILCTSSAHMTRLRNGSETAEAITLSNDAIKSINRRLNDPALSISDGVLIAILAFACHAVMFNDTQGMLTHFNGLEEIIRRRGGLQAFDSNQAIRLILFWVDVNVAFFCDRSPRFPSPDDILMKIDLSPSPLSSGPTLLHACITEESIQAIKELLMLNRHIANELSVRELWDDGVFGGLKLVPVLSKLLSIRYEDFQLDSGAAMQESCRIGAILYLSGIRYKFGVTLIADVYVPKLKDSLIAQDTPHLQKSDPILLWLLVIGGAQSFMHDEHTWFVLALANLVVHHRFSTWVEMMDVVSAILWIDGILEAECNELRVEISTELWSSHGHIFS